MEIDRHCPLCSHLLILKDEYLFCEKGNCGFSKIVHDELLKDFERLEKSILSNQINEMKFYFCPKCGNSLFEDCGRNIVLCNKCNIEIPRRLLHHLREYHSHL